MIIIRWYSRFYDDVTVNVVKIGWYIMIRQENFLGMSWWHGTKLLVYHSTSTLINGNLHMFNGYW